MTSSRRKQLTLVACILGSSVAFLDSSVVNVALPSIQEELGGGLAGQQWVVNAYLLTLGSLLLIGGSLGDVYGERRIFAAGVIGFGVVSAACAAAPTIELLVAARALQGVAGALLVPAALAVITTTFEEDERGAAIGAWTAWSGIGVALGPLLGGQLVDAASWRWVFAINVPLLATTLALIAYVVPAERPTGGRRLDVSGAVLCGVSLAALTFGLIQQPLDGWGAATVWPPLVAGGALFALFVVREARTREPMLPLGLFRGRNFSVGNLETFGMYAGLGLLFFYLVIFLQQVAGYTALEAGATMLPVTAVMLLLASRFGRAADRAGPRLFMAAGPLVAGAGLTLLLRLDSHVSFATDLLPPLGIFAMGLAMTVAPLTATVLGDVEERDAGIASGVNNAVARVAGMVAVAAAGVVIGGQFAAALERDADTASLSAAGRSVVDEAMATPFLEPPVEDLPAPEQDVITDAARSASVDSLRLAMGMAAGLVIAAGVLGALGIRNPRRRVPARDCAGGQLAGQPRDAARRPEEYEPLTA